LALPGILRISQNGYSPLKPKLLCVVCHNIFFFWEHPGRQLVAQLQNKQITTTKNTPPKKEKKQRKTLSLFSRSRYCSLDIFLRKLFSHCTQAKDIRLREHMV